VAWDPKAPRGPRRYYRGEERFFPLLTELGHDGLRLGLIRRGVSPASAQGIVFFLSDQMTLDRHQHESTRVAYRAILLELDVEELRRASLEGLRARELVSA
jgi:hypothetical protein